MDRLLSVKDVAQTLGVSTRTVRRWCQAQAIEHQKCGRQYRIKQSAMEKFGYTPALPQSRKQYTRSPQAYQEEMNRVSDLVHSHPREASTAEPESTTKSEATLRMERFHYLSQHARDSTERSYYERKAKEAAGEVMRELAFKEEQEEAARQRALHPERYAIPKGFDQLRPSE